jgi:hypothetical protein
MPSNILVSMPMLVLVPDVAASLAAAEPDGRRVPADDHRAAGRRGPARGHPGGWRNRGDGGLPRRKVQNVVTDSSDTLLTRGERSRDTDVPIHRGASTERS